MNGHRYTSIGRTPLLGIVCLSALFALLNETSAKSLARPPAIRKPLSTRFVLDITLSLDDERIALVGIKKTDLNRPRPIPRFKGGFTLELYSVGELRDRIHFDFPLGARSPRAIGKPTSRLRSKTTVRVPYDASITRITLLGYDRKSKLEIPLPKTSSTTPLTMGPKRTSAFGPIDALPDGGNKNNVKTSKKNAPRRSKKP